MRILDLKYNTLIFLSLILVISSCVTPKEFIEEPSLLRSTDLVVKTNTLSGWWVYGEGQHIFKDEQTLEEYDLIFPNENMVELVELYLSVCEMEYFPMECQMTGILIGSTLSVQEFEILYVQGCGE
ncbi:MAG: Uncharacterised protein [Cryomorphaceae bacterium]|nr:MAG: Uncharacterised protein [Cryomorphaceae bacterium]